MLNQILTQDQVVMWFQPNGPGTEWEPLGVGENAGGMTGKSIPAIGITPVFGRDRFKKPIVISLNKEAPGGIPTLTIQIFQRMTVDFLLKAVQRGCPLNIQLRGVACPPLDNPLLFDALWHWGRGYVTTYTPGDGPSLEFNGTNMTAEGELTFPYMIQLEPAVLQQLTVTGTDQNLLAIAGIPDETCDECNNGYVGADKILYIGAEADTGVTAKLLYSVDGGGTTAATSADPFAADEHIGFVAVRPLTKNTFRVVVATPTTDAGAKAKFAWDDIVYGAEGTTVWNTVTIAAGVNGDTIQALAWLFPSRGYIATAGDIYVSTDYFETDPGAAIYTGATAINGFAKSPDGKTVWAFGATNLLLRETNQNGIFSARTGPSGGGAFTALAVANDGTIYAGNGQSIFKSINEGENVGGWTELKDFGASHVVKKIQVVGGSKALGGDSQIIRVEVDDTTPGTGEFWKSVNGGASWIQENELTNTGYNDAYFSEVDDNLAILVGDGAVMQRFSI